MTLFLGTQVGRDAAGNVYYRHRALDTKRWVIYHGIVDASKIPAEWHAWLHNMRRNPPRKDSASDDHKWFKPHLANMTGTEMAQTRKPHMIDGASDAPVEYEPWNPTQNPTERR